MHNFERQVERAHRIVLLIITYCPGPTFIDFSPSSPSVKILYLLVGQCHGSNVYVLIKFLCWNCNLQYYDIWSWGFRKIIRSWRWSPNDENSHLIGRAWREMLSLSTIWRHSEKTAFCKPRTRASTIYQVGQHLEYGLPAFRNLKTVIC